jgi:hypothetical protein
MAQPRPIEDRPARPLVDDSGGAQSLVPGRVSASRLERVQGLPRSLGSGPSPGSQPRPRSPAPRWGGITDPRRTDHQSHAAPAPPTRRAEHQNRSSPPDARPHLPRPPLLPLPPPPPSAAASTSPRRFSPPGSTLPPPIATHGLCPPAGIRLPPPRPRPHQHPPTLARPAFTWRVEEGGPARQRGTPFLENPGGKRKRGRGRGGGLLLSGRQQLENNRREQQPPLTAWRQFSAGFVENQHCQASHLLLVQGVTATWPRRDRLAVCDSGGASRER